MSNNGKIDRLRIIVAEILGLDPGEVTGQSGVDLTEDWDSMRHLMIMMEVEQQFGYQFSPDDLSEARTISAIASRLP
jgi:acyl carrier protein